MTQGTLDTLLAKRRGPVDWLTLNRPTLLNAISLKIVDELDEYFGGLYNDGSVRVVVNA